jgi:hypothetical protein
MDKETIVTTLGAELTQLEAEISRLRLTRERATYRLERAVRERDRFSNDSYRSLLPPATHYSLVPGRKLRRQDVNKDRDFRDQEPDAVPIDPEGEQRKLEAAGWERVEDAQGKVFWVNPESGHRYPLGPAISRMRQMQEDVENREGER